MRSLYRYYTVNAKCVARPKNCTKFASCWIATIYRGLKLRNITLEQEKSL